ncbi:MAG TPA: hypothetical protein VNH64_06255 [Parvularculaceae bacterium]|nr:hypothetical protein [Parvularculaceae bacterium]
MTALLAALLLAMIAQTAPEAPTSAPPPRDERARPLDPEYQACIDAVREDAKSGREAAMKWQAESNNSPAAEHCLAVADLAAGYPLAGAMHLQKLAQRADAGEPLVRARIYAEAAEAWLKAGQNGLASKAVEDAFKLAPDAGELYLIKAQIEFAEGRMQATIDAVTAAQERGFESAESHVLRGRALHALTRNREAAEDVVAALKLDPLNVDALVLRGDLHQAGVDIKARYKRAPAQSPSSDG